MPQKTFDLLTYDTKFNDFLNNNLINYESIITSNKVGENPIIHSRIISREWAYSFNGMYDPCDLCPLTA